MKIQIMRRRHLKGGWYWRLKDARGHLVCRSYNEHSLHSDYARKETAIKSANRFLDNVLDERIRIFLEDENGVVIGGNNTY